MRLIGLSKRMSGLWLKEFKESCEESRLAWEVVEIDRSDWVQQLRDLHFFVWRPLLDDKSASAQMRAKMPIMERMGIACFPNSLMLWLFDDKIRESFFLEQHGYPTPKTFISFDLEEAMSYVEKADYPFVAKSHIGASSCGVVLIRNRREAERFVRRMFSSPTLSDKVLSKYYYMPRLAKGDPISQLELAYRKSWPRYAYFQEFLPIHCDWRITTFGGDLLSVFIRRNRPNDFRASGSGSWESVTEQELPLAACELAAAISKEHSFTTMTYDFMQKDNGWVIGEMSFGFLLNNVYSTSLFRKTSNGYRRNSAIRPGQLILNAVLNANEANTAVA